MTDVRAKVLVEVCYFCTILSKLQPPIVEENKHFEFLSVYAYINAHNIVRLSCFYIPPKSVANFSDFDVACQTLKEGL